MIGERTERGLGNGPRAASDGDILLRIAAIVGEIDRLKRERHVEPVLGARAHLATAYYEKRRGRPEMIASDA